MEKLAMCRICLVENVSMYVVVNRNLRELYEKLTDIPFVTEDSRPILACFVCCAKLKQCYRLLRKCLKAEELFIQMMNEDYEPNPINQDHFEFYSGFIKTPTENISIVDECQTESIAIKEELPAVCEGLDDIIKPKEEYQSDELEPENLEYSCLDVPDIPPHHSESDLEDDMPLMEFKTEVEEEQEVRARETKRATIEKKPKVDTRRTKPEDATTAEQTRTDKSDLIVIRKIQKRTSKPGSYFKKPLKSDQSSFSVKGHLSKHIRKDTGDKLYKCDVCHSSFSAKGILTRHIRKHTGEKPYKCDVCQRSFNQKGNLTKHILIHTGEKPYKCDVCQLSFRVKGALKVHIRIHTGEKPYKCEVCQQSFSAKDILTKHFRKHTGEKPYKCDVCQRSFSVKYTLTNHIRKHTGEKPYKCDVCQRSFCQMSVLTNHKKKNHTVDKLYKCDVCQRSFSVKGTLNQHLRIHPGEIPYKCDLCQSSFSQKGVLEKHSRKHTVEKPY